MYQNSDSQPGKPTLIAQAYDLFDLSAHKVCHALNVTIKAVSSYLAFSPLPVIESKFLLPGSIFSVALSVFRNVSRNPSR